MGRAVDGWGGPVWGPPWCIAINSGRCGRGCPIEPWVRPGICPIIAAMGAVDVRVFEVASRQHGVVTRDQLREAAISPGAIDYRLECGVLRSIHRGVYGCGPIRARYEREMAAALACGAKAALSHRTAAAIHGVLRPRHSGAPIELVGPRSLRGPAVGVRLYRVGAPAPDEVALEHELPVTTPARTLIDLATVIGPHDLERALARALRQKLVRLAALRTLLDRSPPRKGIGSLRALISDAAGPSLTRSEAEARFLTLVRRSGISQPRSNVVLMGREVDFFWPTERLIVEVDGFAYHDDRQTFEDDRGRDAGFQAAGYPVIRFTWRQITTRPEVVLAQLALALGAAGARRVNNAAR